jgi:hypothetical protein
VEVGIQEALIRLGLKQVELDRAYDRIRDLEAMLSEIQSPDQSVDELPATEGEEGAPDEPA